MSSSGAVVAAWPAAALVGFYELLMVIIRSGQVPTGTAAGPGASCATDNDLLRAQASEEFAGEVAAGRVPSVRVIRRTVTFCPALALLLEAAPPAGKQVK